MRDNGGFGGARVPFVDNVVRQYGPTFQTAAGVARAYAERVIARLDAIQEGIAYLAAVASEQSLLESVVTIPNQPPVGALTDRRLVTVVPQGQIYELRQVTLANASAGIVLLWADDQAVWGSRDFAGNAGDDGRRARFGPGSIIYVSHNSGATVPQLVFQFNRRRMRRAPRAVATMRPDSPVNGVGDAPEPGRHNSGF